MTPDLPPVRMPWPSIRRKAIALLALGTLALALAGCDKCGDFVWNKPGACRDYGPPQR